MKIDGFVIQGIDPLPSEGFMRGHVVISIADPAFGEPPVECKVDIGCFIKHDGGSSTLETIEGKFLEQARRLLSEAAGLLALPDATAIRARADAPRLARAAELQAVLSTEG